MLPASTSLHGCLGRVLSAESLPGLSLLAYKTGPYDLPCPVLSLNSMFFWVLFFQMLGRCHCGGWKQGWGQGVDARYISYQEPLELYGDWAARFHGVGHDKS